MYTSSTSSEYFFLECSPIRPLVMERTTTTTKWRFNNELTPNCPRCASSNTKFCYYNNYSLSQPRYFCKGCRRYWTKGGSLRNVPVGGGCRKSRRARATRQGGGSHYAGPTHSSMSMGSTNESKSGTNIDLAAVFAKYVNQNVKNNNDDSSSPGARFTSSDNVQTSSLDIDSQLDDITMFEYQKLLDLINGGGDDQIQQVFPDQLISIHEDINGQDFVYRDCNAFEPQGTILGDEQATDILWSSDGSNLPNFGSQQTMVQLQDFELFSSDDQLRIPTNLVSDNWGSFDLSAYEPFSRP